MFTCFARSRTLHQRMSYVRAVTFVKPIELCHPPAFCLCVIISRSNKNRSKVIKIENVYGIEGPSLKKMYYLENLKLGQDLKNPTVHVHKKKRKKKTRVQVQH